MWRVVTLVIVILLIDCAAAGDDDPCIADLCFLLDVSGSTKGDDWDNTKQFATDFVERLDIGPDQTRVGAVLFGDNYTFAFPLNAYNNKDDVKDAISNLTHPINELTYLGRGIQGTKEYCFNEAHGDRNNVYYPNIMIVVTDGGVTYSDRSNTEEQADLAHAEQITILALGIRNDAFRMQTFLDITQDDTDRIFISDSPADLVNEVAAVYHMYCNVDKVYCVAEFKDYDLWDFSETPKNLPDDGEEILIEYNPVHCKGRGCKFQVVWNRQGNGDWMSISVGTNPDVPAGYFRTIEFEHESGTEPTQHGWKCYAGLDSICGNPPVIDNDPYYIANNPSSPFEAFAHLSQREFGPIPISWVVDGMPGIPHEWCPRTDNDPKYALTYYFEPYIGGARMVFELDRGFYLKHQSELTGWCLPA